MTPASGIWDAWGGAAVVRLGHDHRHRSGGRHQGAGRHACLCATGAFYPTHLRRSSPNLLIDRAPSGTGQGRSDVLGRRVRADGAALKLARQYHVERGDNRDAARLSRAKPSYHGNTRPPLATGGTPDAATRSAPLLIGRQAISDAAYDYACERGRIEGDFALRRPNLLTPRSRPRA